MAFDIDMEHVFEQLSIAEKPHMVEVPTEMSPHLYEMVRMNYHAEELIHGYPAFMYLFVYDCAYDHDRRYIDMYDYLFQSGELVHVSPEVEAILTYVHAIVASDQDAYHESFLSEKEKSTLGNFMMYFLERVDHDVMCQDVLIEALQEKFDFYKRIFESIPPNDPRWRPYEWNTFYEHFRQGLNYPYPVCYYEVERFIS